MKVIVAIVGLLALLLVATPTLAHNCHTDSKKNNKGRVHKHTKNTEGKCVPATQALASPSLPGGGGGRKPHDVLAPVK